jgi:hypothetical protein
MNIKRIQELVEWSEQMVYLEVFEKAWQIRDDEVDWYLCPDMDFLYSSEIQGEILRKDGLVMVNIDNGCGETVSMVFLESEEIK